MCWSVDLGLLVGRVGDDGNVDLTWADQLQAVIMCVCVRVSGKLWVSI